MTDVEVDALAKEEHDLAAQSAPSSLVLLLYEWWPLLLGNVLEWYDFGVYGYLSDQMQHNFFGGSAAATWLGFAVTFFSRPLGGIVLGWLADRWGRRPVALISMVGMTLATVAQGLLPTGFLGCVLLVALRLLQGLSAGGEVGALGCYLAESAPKKTLAFTTSWSVTSGTLAFVLSSGGVAMLAQQLGPSRMSAWGWRLPFLAALPPGLVALAGRRRLRESPGFERSGPHSSAPGVLALFRSHWRAVVVGFGATSMFSTMFYVGPIWSIAHLKDRGADPVLADWAGCLAQLVACMAMLGGGHLADSVGVGMVVLLAALVVLLVGLPAFAFLQAYPHNVEVLFLGVSVGFGAAGGLSGSTMYLFCLELFPAHMRALGFGLSFNLAVTYFGGCGALIAQALLKISPWGPGIYLSASGMVAGCAVMWGFRQQARGRLRMAHIRPELHSRCSCCGQPARSRGSTLTAEGMPEDCH